MVLSDAAIEARLRLGVLVVERLEEKDWPTHIQPASLDLTLGDEISYYMTPFDQHLMQVHRHSTGRSRHVIVPRLSGGMRLDSRNLPDESHVYRTHLKPDSALHLGSGCFCLATTREFIRLPTDLLARVEGRSSIGRLGVTAHVTAGIIDPGFEGEITLEIANLGPNEVVLYPGQRICQLVFEELDAPSQRPYGHPSRNSKYQGQRGATVARTDKKGTQE